MKILACFKITRDFESITSSELTMLRDGVMDVSVFKRIIGVYDEAALENARRLAVSVRENGNCTLHALTVGECESKVAKNLYALGFDEVIKVRFADDTHEHGANRVAEGICGQAESIGRYDVILTGRQAWPFEFGLTPYIVAQRLSMPCIPNVVDLELNPKGVCAVSQTDAGILTRIITRPAVYIMGEARYPYLQIATLKEKMTAGNKAVIEMNMGTSEFRELCESCEPHEHCVDNGRLLKLLYENEEKLCRYIEGGTAREKAETLWQEVFTK
jgi:electron transfer flavoprotein alpha/beta subunit